MTFRVSRSLQLRLVLTIVLLIFGSLVALALLFANRQEARLKDLLSEQQFSTVGYVAEDVDAKVRLRVDALARIAQRLADVNLDDPLRIERFLSDRVVVHDLFEFGLVVVRPDMSGAYGDFPAVPGRRLGPFRVSPFVDVVRDGTPAVGPPRLGRSSDKPVAVIAVPVRNREGKLIAILGGVTSVTSYNFLDLVARERLGRAADFLVIAPRHGVVVVGSVPEAALRALPPEGADKLLDRFAGGFEGSGIGINAQGVEELASGRRVASTGWVVIAKLPTSEAFAAVREFHHLIVGGALGFAGLIGLIAAVFLRRSLAPLERAATVFDAMTRGAEPLRALPVERDDEVGRLVESFNTLQHSLNQERDALKDSEEKLRTLLQAIPDAIQFKDAEGRWLEYNAGAQRAFGLEEHDCHGLSEQKLAELAPPRARKSLLQCRVTDEIAWREGHACRMDEVVQQPDGNTFVFDVIKVPLFHEDGRRKAMVVIGRDISDARRASEALRRSLNNFNNLVERIPVGVFRFRMCPDGSERFEYVSPRWCALADLAAEEAYRDVASAYRRVHPGDLESLREANRNARSLLQPFQWEGRFLNDGKVRWMHIESSPTVQANGDIVWEGIQYDITERREAEEKLHLGASVFSHAREGICITDAAERIIDVNPTFCEMTGYSRDEAIGKTPRLLRSGHHNRPFYSAMWEAVASRGYWRGEIWNRHRDGGLRVQLLTISAVHDDSGGVSHYLGVFSDISQIKENEKQLERLAHYDALTGIPNRLLLTDRLHQAIIQARRSGTLLAVCYLDLDAFKEVNDHLGHEAGDQLLVEVARRLQLAMRNGDTVARLGGDEFIFLLPGFDRPNDCEVIVQRIIADLAKPFAIADHEVTVMASIGIALYPKDGVQGEVLMRHADEAMYAAKNAGGNRYAFYDPEDGSRD